MLDKNLAFAGEFQSIKYRHPLMRPFWYIMWFGEFIISLSLVVMAFVTMFVIGIAAIIVISTILYHGLIKPLIF